MTNEQPPQPNTKHLQRALAELELGLLPDTLTHCLFAETTAKLWVGRRSRPLIQRELLAAATTAAGGEDNLVSLWRETPGFASKLAAVIDASQNIPDILATVRFFGSAVHSCADNALDESENALSSEGSLTKAAWLLMLACETAMEAADIMSGSDEPRHCNAGNSIHSVCAKILHELDSSAEYLAYATETIG